MVSSDVKRKLMQALEDITPEKKLSEDLLRDFLKELKDFSIEIVEDLCPGISKKYPKTLSYSTAWSSVPGYLFPDRLLSFSPYYGKDRISILPNTCLSVYCEKLVKTKYSKKYKKLKKDFGKICKTKEIWINRRTKLLEFCKLHNSSLELVKSYCPTLYNRYYENSRKPSK